MPGPDASCPNASFHGNPYRQCPTCDWREETLQERAERMRREAGLLSELRGLEAEVGAVLAREDTKPAVVTSDEVGRTLDEDVKERTIRHMQTAHAAEIGLLDDTWLDHPVKAHEQIHQSRPEDLPPPSSTPVDIRLSDGVDNLQVRLRERLGEMLGATLQPIVIDALALQVSLTTASWIRGHAYGLMHDSREQLEMLRLADVALLEP